VSIVTNTAFRRYALLLGSLCGSLCAVSALFFSYLAFQISKDRARDSLAFQARLIDGELATQFRAIHAQLERIENLPWGAAGLNAQSRGLEYEKLLSTQPIVMTVRHQNIEGDVKLTARRDRATDFTVRSNPKQNMGTTFSLVVPESSLRMYRIAADSAAIEVAAYPRSKADSVSVATLNLQTLSEELSRMLNSPVDSAFLIEPSGLLLAHSDRVSSIDTGTSSLRKMISSVIAQSSADVSSPAGYIAIQSEDILRRVFWRRLNSSNWILVVDRADSIFMQPILQSMRWGGLITLFGLACSLIASYWLARKMTRPIVALSKSANELAKGNLDHRIPAAQISEFQTVAQSFNDMAEELKTLTTDLENKVREKTSLLQTEFSTREIQTKEIVKLEERARIMRDFHDGVGGHLVGLLGAAKRDALDAKQIEAMVSDALIDFRIAIDSLSPEETDMVTALASLRFRLTARLEASGLQSNWSLAALPDHLPFSRETIFHVQRIVAEAITNAIKHASATRIDVSACVKSTPAETIIDVMDDGLGFAQIAQLEGTHSGRGISNMEQRAALIGARISWEFANLSHAPSRERRGTLVRLRLPIPGGETPS
jgi:signal transduction histidine kinase